MLRMKEVTRHPHGHGLEMVSAVHHFPLGSSTASIHAEAIVPTGRPIRARLHDAATYSDPYVEIHLIDERDREVARSRAYTSTPEAVDAKAFAITGAAQALVALSNHEEPVKVDVAGESWLITMEREIASQIVDTVTGSS